MNNIGWGPWLVKFFTRLGTQVLRGIGATTAIDPTYDAASLAADRVESTAVNFRHRDLSPTVLSNSTFQSKQKSKNEEQIKNGDTAPSVGNSCACSIIERTEPSLHLGSVSSSHGRKDLNAEVANQRREHSQNQRSEQSQISFPRIVSGDRSQQRIRCIAVQSSIRVLRRMMLRSFFMRWSELTFLYLRNGIFPDNHTLPLATTTPMSKFRLSSAFEHLRAKLHWILFWLKFFRLTQRAQRLFAMRFRLWFRTYWNRIFRQTSATMPTWLLQSLDLLVGLKAYVAGWAIRCTWAWLSLFLVSLICPVAYLKSDVPPMNWIAFPHHITLTVCVGSIGIVYAGSFLSTAIPCCFASYLCMVLESAALALIFVMDTIEWAGAIAELVVIVLMSHLPILKTTSQLVYSWLGLLHFLKWWASNERAMLILDSPLVLTILMRCERTVSLSGERPLLYASVSSESPYLVEIAISKSLVRASEDHCIIASQCGAFVPRSRWPLLEMHSSIAVFDGASSIWYLGVERSICHLRKTCPMHRLCTPSTAAPPNDRPVSLQLILYLTDGSSKVLQGLFLNSSVAELYRYVEGQLGFKKLEFSLTCRHRTLMVSGASLKNVITHADDCLSVFIKLKGAGHDTPDRGRAKHSQLKIPEKEQRGSSVSGYSLRRRPYREIQIQPLVRDPIYELGSVSRAVKADLEELVQRCNASEERQKMCSKIRQTSARCLRVTQEPGKGRGVQVVAPITQGTRLCYYSGMILDHDSRSNHCLELLEEEISEYRKGQPHKYTVYLDGDAGITAQSQGVASMQMVNHKCEENSNCSAVHVMFHDDGTGLGMLALDLKEDITLEDLQNGPVFLSFDYGGTFFRPEVEGELTPEDHIRVCCGCGDKGVCPRKMIRFERDIRDRLPLIHLVRSVADGEHQPRIVALVSASGLANLSSLAKSSREDLISSAKDSVDSANSDIAPVARPLGPITMSLPESLNGVVPRNMIDSNQACNTLAGAATRAEESRLSSAAGITSNLGTRLNFHLLDGSLRYALEGADVNTQPYGLLCGTASFSWRNRSYVIPVNDEIQAARGEGACGLLCVLDVVHTANSDQPFRSRIKEHTELRGDFQDKWDILVSLKSDKGAEGLRVIIYCHAITHKKRFGTLFRSGACLPEEDLGHLINFERQNNFVFAEDDLPCSVRIAAFRFLSLSDHLTESFLTVLLDWLDHKVALLPFMQVPMDGVDVSNFFHIPELNLISDKSVLLSKMLNIERQDGSRVGLNHFDRVGGQQPMCFLEDLRLADVNSMTESPVAKAELSTIPLPTHFGNTDHIAELTEVLHRASSPLPGQRVTVSTTVLMQSLGPVAVSKPEAESKFVPRSTASLIVGLGRVEASMVEGLNRVVASAVTLNLTDKSPGKLVQMREPMYGVEKLAAIPPRRTDVATTSADKSAAVVDKIVSSSRMRSDCTVASDDRVDLETQRETTTLGCAQQVHLCNMPLVQQMRKQSLRKWAFLLTRCAKRYACFTPLISL